MFDIFVQNLWIAATALIFLCGIYFSFKLGFIHLKFKEMFKAITKKSDKKNSISPFQALSMSLAGRIGVGSLSGIALSVYLGGPGVLFWIWLTSLLCAPNTFAESVLAVIFRKKDSGNIYRGGPFYYISEGLKNHKLAVFYAGVILIAFVAGFSTIQVNTMTKCINSLISIDPIIIGLVIVGISGITILGGIKSIASATSKVIPVVTATYLVVCIYIISLNISSLPQILIDIFNSSLNFKAFGMGILSTLLIGMQKGIFSSEVGLGTGSIAAATSDSESPAHNGLVQVFGIHVENLVIATITVLVICMSNYGNLSIPDANGVELTLHAFEYHLGPAGPIFITATISLFAISTVLTGYYYGESSLKFIKDTNIKDIRRLKIVSLAMLLIGCIISSRALWDIVDILVGLIAIINTYAIFRLRKFVIREYKEYKKKI